MSFDTVICCIQKTCQAWTQLIGLFFFPDILFGFVFFFKRTLIREHCRDVWGVTPREDWIRNEYGGRHLLMGHSNIVFSSGGFDGWSSGGVATNVTENDLTSIFIQRGGHHLDLMFSHKDDPSEVVRAREYEMKAVQRWVEQFRVERVAMKAMSWGDVLAE